MKHYVPRPGSIAARALLILEAGPVRAIDLAAAVGEHRGSIFMSMKTVLKHKLVVRTRIVVPGQGGRAQTFYALPDYEDDEKDDAPPVRVLIAGPGVLPVSREAIAASNPFGARA